MRTQSTIVVASLLFAFAGLALSVDAGAQIAPRRLAVKNGESIEIGTVYYVANCRSIMIGLPDVEVLEGPPEVTLSIREESVLPRRQGCASKVSGGTLVLTAKGVTEKTEAPLTYRLKYKTKDGPRESSNAYIVSLFP